MEIPIIDIFAGPGGLGEGFSAYSIPNTRCRQFKIVLSIEKERYAHQTLTLRSFFRQFEHGEVPFDYYEFVKGNIPLNTLFEKWPVQAEKARAEAWLAELGDGEKAESNETVNRKIKEALNGRKDWLLIGGPPCQAYSVVGRVRRQEKILDEKKDERVGLNKQYLRILAVHNPTAFVMENVKGLLSAKTQESPVFSKIISDLTDPVKPYLFEYRSNGIKLDCPGYKIYSLIAEPDTFDSLGNPVFRQEDFIIYSERYGVPQTRHRVILLGIRKDIDILPGVLEPLAEIPVSSVLTGLPRLRSALSRMNDNGDDWKASLMCIFAKGGFSDLDKQVEQEIEKQLGKLTLPQKKTGGEYIPYTRTQVKYQSDWYLDSRLGGACNHTARSHMESDLLRYLFVSCFAKIKKRSPKLEDFPSALLPNHKNVKAGIEDRKFTDRFRVQLWDNPCKTVTSHISKDGHYYIHPDPTQCRSLTVREAARIQTFSDNYFFCGPRTSQYNQVGNAVPPILANKIADIVYKVFSQIEKGKNLPFEKELSLNKERLKI